MGRRVIGGGVLAAMMLSSSWADEVLVSWDATEPGMLSPRWSASVDARWVGRTYLASARNLDIEILRETSEKAKLFGGIPILKVGGGSPEAAGFALRGRAFLPPLRKGGLEFQIAVETGRVFLTLGQNPTEFLDRNDRTVLLKSADGFLTLILEANGSIRWKKNTYHSQSTTGLEVGRPYTLRVMWDFDGEEPHFTAFLNDEPLINEADGRPFSVPVSPEDAQRGVDSFVISGDKDGGSGYFIGKILSISQ